MSKTFLILDVNFLMHRAFHVFHGLSHGKQGGTGAVFGVFRDLIRLQDQHATNDVVFCFDHGKKLKRQEVFPAYKKKRQTAELPPEGIEAVIELRRQIKLLREEYLPYLGYQNVYSQAGYEADDLIASAVQSLKPEDEAVLVSADKDLYQLLRKNVVLWNPKSDKEVKCSTVETFKDEFGAHPDLWPRIKAIAGCATDEVPGVKGVGEKTAAKYLTGGKVRDALRTSIDLWVESPAYQISLDLVRLPYTGTMDVNPVEDSLDERRWRKLTGKLGMKSIVDKAPVRVEGFGFKKVKITRTE